MDTVISASMTANTPDEATANLSFGIEGVSYTSCAPRVAEMRLQMEELDAAAHPLGHLALYCRGDEQPDCPIIHDLAFRGPRPAIRARLDTNSA